MACTCKTSEDTCLHCDHVASASAYPKANPLLFDRVGARQYGWHVQNSQPLLNHIVDALNEGHRVVPGGSDNDVVAWVVNRRCYVVSELWQQHDDVIEERHGPILRGACEDFFDFKDLHCKPLQPKPNPVDSESFDLSVPVPTDFIETINKAQEAKHGQKT